MSGFRLPVCTVLVVAAGVVNGAHAISSHAIELTARYAPPIDNEGHRTHRPKGHGYAKIRRDAKKRRNRR